MVMKKKSLRVSLALFAMIAAFPATAGQSFRLAEAENTTYPDPERWNTFRDHSDKTTTLGGAADVYSGNKVTLGASAEYTMPDKEKTDTAGEKPDNQFAIGVSLKFSL